MALLRSPNILSMYLCSRINYPSSSLLCLMSEKHWAEISIWSLTSRPLQASPLATDLLSMRETGRYQISVNKQFYIFTKEGSIGETLHMRTALKVCVMLHDYSKHIKNMSESNSREQGVKTGKRLFSCFCVVCCHKTRFSFQNKDLFYLLVISLSLGSINRNRDWRELWF